MAVTATNKPGPNGDGQNGWTEYRRLVLAELERLSAAVAASQVQGNNMQMATTQAINDAKHVILDRLHDTIKAVEDDYDKKFKIIGIDCENKVKDLEIRQNRKCEEFKRDLAKHWKDLERTDKKLERTAKELTILKSKAALLGALAGFLVALAGVLASIFL